MDPHLLDRMALEAASGPVVRRSEFWPYALKGVVLTLALVIGVLGLRADLLVATETSIFWIKLLLPGVFLVLSVFAALRSIQPGHKVMPLLSGLLIIFLCYWGLAFYLEGPQWRESLWGTTWQSCPIYIILLAAPLWLLGMLALRRWGSLSPILSGGLFGLASGSFAALVYALHCRENGLMFLGCWYVLGALLPALAGAITSKPLFGIGEPFLQT